MKTVYFNTTRIAVFVCILVCTAFICVITLMRTTTPVGYFKSGYCLPSKYETERPTADFETILLKDPLTRRKSQENKRENQLQLDDKKWAQGQKLKVYLVPHSHNDPGWLQTFENYYTSTTRNILNNMLNFLHKYPDQRFVWAEIVFFERWWQELDDNQRFAVRRLIDNKQLEIIGGGWVMPDEASTHYVSFLVQLIEGHQWIKRNLNCTPNRGWVIDPFGLSPTYAFLQKRAGMESTVLTRVHYELKEFMAKEREFEFNWRQTWDGSGQTEMLTHVMPSTTYDTADTCGPDHYVCRKFSDNILGFGSQDLANEATIRESANDVIEQFRKKAKKFKSKNILVPLGGDFKWNTAVEWKAGLAFVRAIIEFINGQEHLHMEVKMSTLDEYFTALQEDVKTSGKPLKSWSGDFFTYSQNDKDYWSGYFTSRIFHKASERQLMALLRSAQISFTLMTAQMFKERGNLSFPFINSLLDRIIQSRRNLSLFQHHDGITGTSKDHVVVDYAKKIDESIRNCLFVLQQSLFVLTHINDLQENQLEKILDREIFLESTLERDNWFDLWHGKLIEVSENENQYKIVTVFNSLTETRMELIRLNVSDPNVKVFDLNNNEIPSEIFPVINYANSQNSGSKVKISSSSFNLVFLAKLQSLETKSFKIFQSRRQNNPEGSTKIRILNTKSIVPDELKFFNLFDISTGESSKGKQIQISNSHFQLKFNENGILNYMKQQDGQQILLNMQFLYYKTYLSGLYLFLPSQVAVPVVIDNPVIIIVEGKLQSYIHVYYETVHQKITLEKHKGIASHSVQVELLEDVRAQANYELIMRLNTNVKSYDTFYTDSNGFQIIKRKFSSDLPIQGNYYPVASSAYIEDSDQRVTLLAGQPGGASSLASGQLEIMLDRILTQDDGKGVGQGGTDNLRVISKFKIMVEKPSCAETESPHESLSLEAHHQLHQLLYPLTTFVEADTANYGVGVSGRPMDYSLGNLQQMPCDIHLANVVPLPLYEQYSQVPQARSETALMLHKLGFDPRFDVSYLLDTCEINGVASGRFKVGDIFGNLISPRMERLSLNLVHEEELVYATDAFPFKSMEMYAFQAHFQKQTRSFFG